MPSTNWSNFLDRVNSHLESLAESGCDMPFFRGHSDNTWKLLCGLGRQSPEEFKKQNLESILYYDFMSLAGPTLGKDADSWDVLFAMRHHGLPTRLLDWTTTFAVALYFAVQPHEFLQYLKPSARFPHQPCVWILDPFELNRLCQGEPVIANPRTDFDGNYQENFIERSKELGSDIVAIYPTRLTPRQMAQRSVFTLHEKPLEKLAPKFATRFDLPLDCVDDAISFLALAGINEYTLFPDLDGLARHLKKEHVSWF